MARIGTAIVLVPSPEPGVHTFPQAIPLRQVPPWDPCIQPVQYPIEHHPVVLSRLPPCFGFSGGNRPFTFLHCSSVISCRFILLFYHCFSLGATICLKTRSREQKLSQSTVRRAVHDLRKAELLETEQRYRARGGKNSLLFLPEEDVTEMHLPSRSLCALAVADVRNLLM